MEYRVGRRGVRARETAPEHRVDASAAHLQSPVYHVTVTDRGRLVLPVEIREKLKIKDGDKVAVAIEADGSISVTTRDVALKMLRGMYKHLVPRGSTVATDGLIAERRREARLEDRRTRELLERLRRRERRRRRP